MASDREALIAERVVQQVAELPDRTSPDDWPDAMLVTSDELKAIVLAALAAPPSAQEGWQPIETAPKGSWLSGPNHTEHPDYVKPPRLWLLLDDGEPCVGYADAYYAEGGNGYDGGSYWVEKFSGERVRPTHWMPLPPPPAGAPKS